MIGDLFSDARPPFQFDADPTGQRDTALPRDSRQTMASKVAALLQSKPDEWIDGREFLKIAGAYGWRTRISDCRRAPWFLTIENRQRRVNGYTVSEYRLVPAEDHQSTGGAA